MIARDCGGAWREYLACAPRSASAGSSTGRFLEPGNAGHMNACSSRVTFRCGVAVVVPVMRGTCSGTATHDQGVGPCSINRCTRENDLRGSFILTCSVCPS